MRYERAIQSEFKAPPLKLLSIGARSSSETKQIKRITQETTHMSTTTKISAIALALLTLAPVTANANSIDNRQANQADRIEKGRQTGSVTWTEGIKLRAEQRKISRTEAKLKSDGYLSSKDKRVLTKMQNKASKHIVTEKHDGLKRVDWLPRVGK
jgi:hypothetical protein